ncbi:ribosome assembly protein 3 [Colletotrichum tofieldiae]|uniref:Ribosome assembly protein 3 n=1 Tax=Colletotrichum tofieldiae TaxID=708197 RepID=A0A166W8K3_9PEZI|nr:ribosome assembly protein 3 [Colletotrichum tofieldiae]GKT63755.1 ribosome assembly protein 3 [Colletotrichum tofieldiae]GKT72240.1 ribosome assembly protein 3 [Colletotrichum tofieldiae]GKT89947.1 ribosome assembly protein 3 [Colletotrichum tofieldiae]
MAATTAASQEFAAFYLQRTTQEFAEDLDKVREADDFKADSVPFLVHALQQGTALYSARDQERVVKPATAAAATEGEDVDMTEAATEEVEEEKEAKSGRKEKKDKSKKKKTSG